MKVNSQELREIADLTLKHYDQRAEEFWEGTRDHDVGQNIEALLQRIESVPPFSILDFGCGPGRDLRPRSGPPMRRGGGPSKTAGNIVAPTAPTIANAIRGSAGYYGVEPRADWPGRLLSIVLLDIHCRTHRRYYLPLYKRCVLC
jgi:hypothetical protein